MSERTCHVCGAPAHIFDRKGGWCQTHWDEAWAAKKADEKRQTEEAGGPWPHTCPYRMHDMGPWERKENLDTWSIREQFHDGLVARHCDFCGSLHPDDLVRLVTEEGYRASGTDKSYKVYVNSPAGQQVSKFKTAHLTNEHRAKLREFYDRTGGGGMSEDAEQKFEAWLAPYNRLSMRVFGRPVVSGAVLTRNPLPEIIAALEERERMRAVVEAAQAYRERVEAEAAKFGPWDAPRGWFLACHRIGHFFMDLELAIGRALGVR